MIHYNQNNRYEKLTKEDISQKYLTYDDYAHNKIERRQFIEKLSLFAGTLTLPSLLVYDTNYLDPF
jgi:carboxymethylenebutenolidase